MIQVMSSHFEQVVRRRLRTVLIVRRSALKVRWRRGAEHSYLRLPHGAKPLQGILERVRANYSEWPNVEIVQGVVPEVLPTVPVKNVAFLHIDMNCAYPERAAFEHFWDLLSPGAMALLDDYAYFGYESAAEAINSAAASLGADVLSLPTGQGLIIR